MNFKRFSEITEEILSDTNETLVKKQGEYNLGDDKLASFKHGAGITGWTPQKVLLGYLVKHWTSIIDMINSDKKFTRERWMEKVGDAINYNILLMCLLEDGDMFLEENKDEHSR